MASDIKRTFEEIKAEKNKLRRDLGNVFSGVVPTEKSLALEELNQQGFPDFMILAFIMAARTTKSIVSSRPPGGVGVELMEEGYDLKGFQIKAKSCDWGPMAGFICQLPFFNKAGFDKIAYNTKYIIDYLIALNLFNGPGAAIAKIEAAIEELRPLLFFDSLIDVDSKQKILEKLGQVRVEFARHCSVNTISNADNRQKVDTVLSIDNIEKRFNKLQRECIALDRFDAILTPQDKARKAAADAALTDAQRAANLALRNPGYLTFSSIKKIVYRAYDKEIDLITKKYQQEENDQSRWSGENSIPTGVSPFVQLKRRYTESEMIALLKNTNGIDATTVSDIILSKELVAGLAEKIVTGTAYNNADKTKSTIKVDFLLRKLGEGDVWAIYHGDIYYTNTGGAFSNTPYNFNSTATVAGRVFQDLGIKPKQALKGNLTDIEFREYIKKNQQQFDDDNKKYESRRSRLEQIFKLDEAGILVVNNKHYYPLCGIVNPHPPYQIGDEFYKNAVSGDFDLFAFWPDAELSAADLDLVRLSEIRLNKDLKLFTNASRLFGIDFIPGFKELEMDGMKESAELGNISTLGGQIASLLNSYAETIHQNIYGGEIEANKAFHSDEGGRPGIMEVEFPIAFFFPNKIKSKALNNLGISPKKVSERNEYVNIVGGLIKNIEEFLQLLIDINFTKKKNSLSVYKIMMHSEWMMHFFFISFPFNEQQLFVNDIQKIIDGKASRYDDELGQVDKQVLVDKLKEYNKIKEAPGSKAVNQVSFVKNLKILLRGESEKDEEKKVLNPYLQMDDSVFSDLREKFLLLAFKADEKAINKKVAVEIILAVDN